MTDSERVEGVERWTIHPCAICGVTSGNRVHGDPSHRAEWKRVEVISTSAIEGVIEELNAVDDDPVVSDHFKLGAKYAAAVLRSRLLPEEEG